eukprot:1015365-Amphidinium_carterae.1
MKASGKELDARKFSTDERQLWEAADIEQFQAHLKAGAIELVEPSEAEAIRKGPMRSCVLPVASRFVRNN